MKRESGEDVELVAAPTVVGKEEFYLPDGRYASVAEIGYEEGLGMGSTPLSCCCS